MQLARKNILSILLLALMLFGQNAALVHQFEHDLHANHGDCQQCLTQSVFDDTAVDTCHGFATQLATHTIELSVSTNSLPLRHSYYPSRAPPISLT